ncbi:hypothetical protein IT568_03845, partial [bacterium]|nr:hypothetical protein [bacterium]
MKKLIFLLPFLVLACAEEKDLSSSKAIFLTAEIVTPASWDDVKGIVPINVLVSPENQTDSVRILINGNSAVTLKTSPFTFDWDTNGLSGGQTILAEATSSEGQIFLSQKTTVYVKSETSLSVNLVNPANFSTVTGNVLIKVSAFDAFGISKVEFFQNGNLLGEDTTEPYEFIWDTSGISGDFALNAKAYNSLGDFRETYPISVKINPSDVVPPTVYVSSPASFSEVSGTVKITAVASDDKGIASVSFYVD